MTRPPDYPTAPQSRTGPVRDCLLLHTVPPTPPQRRCPGPPSAPPTTTKGRHRPHLSESSADRRVPRPSPLVLTPRPLRIGGFGFSVDEGSRALLIASLSAAYIKNDDQGNTRLAKDGKHNRARDDVAAALLLAAGAFERANSAPVRKLSYASV